MHIIFVPSPCGDSSSCSPASFQVPAVVTVRPVVARYVGKRRLAEIMVFGVGSVGDKIATGAIGSIAPDVAQIKEMTDFVGSGAPQVERSGRTAGSAKGGVENHHAISVG